MRGGEGHPFMKYTYEFKRQMAYTPFDGHYKRMVK